MTPQTIGGKYVVRSQQRRGQLGVWHAASHMDGHVRGALRLTSLDAGATQRLRHAIWAVGGLQLQGVLPVIDQVTEGTRQWLITSMPASPTLAQALTAGITLPQEAALLIAVETGQTLAHLHETENAHGQLSTENVVLGAAGVVLLAECGYASAVSGSPPHTADDVASWAQLLRELAGVRQVDTAREALLQAAGAADASGMPAALGILAGIAQQMPGFGERSALAALAASVPPTALEEQTTLDLPGPLSIRNNSQHQPTQQGQRAPQAVPAPEDAVNLRFGRGVPSGPPPQSSVSPAIWQPAHTAMNPQAQPKKKRKRLLTSIASGLLTLAIVAVAAYLFWPRPPLAVQSAAMQPVPIKDGDCDVQVKITATIVTNGQRGTIKYRWVRNDNTETEPIERSVSRGESTVEVVLFWRFEGRGTYKAQATLQVLSPTPTQASKDFTYHCR